MLFFVVLGLPFALRWVAGKQTKLAGGGAEAELVVITANQEGIRREFADAFSEWHREKYGKSAVVHYLHYGAAEIVKYFDAAGSQLKVDAVWGGGDYLFDQQLKRPGYLEAVDFGAGFLREVYPKADLGGVALYDPGKPPTWFGTSLNSFGIVYNKDVLKYLGVGEMRTWRDLSDPKLMGWVALADPTRSSSAKQTFMVIVERAMADATEQGRSEDEGWAEGMGLIRQIAANARIFTESSSIVPIMVSTGDAGAGMAIDFYGRSQAGAVGDARMGYVEPAGATIMNPDPIAVVKGAAHRETAIRFIQFVLSERGQRLWNTWPGAPGGPKQTAIRRLPIRESVFADMRDFTDPVNPYKTAGGFNKSNAREKTWGVLGELIEASCISLLEELSQTRKAILASPRAKELDAKLGRFPFDQKEALRRLEEWKKAPAGRRLEVKRRWEEEFREEYRRLKQQAERGTTHERR
ncbi:MAG: extracellular solute-binding protein [Planctomycetota bacterium]|nr:extracellular solute-binding protein [Planctomycetota bacterium]